jgi:glucose-6-phosphate isomerase
MLIKKEVMEMPARYADKSWRESMRITLDFNNAMDSAVGDKHGIREDEINELKSKVEEISQKIKEDRKLGKLPFMDLPYRREDAREVLQTVSKSKDRFDNFVVVGIGGSALGNIALQTALNHPYYNLLPKDVRRGHPRLFVPDNIDPGLLAGLLETIDVKRSLFNVITKSGGTAETIANFLVIRDKLIKEVGKERYREHIIATTDPEKGELRKIAEKEGFATFSTHPGVGGRFSVLTPVGLLSSAMTGIDIEELLAGAAYMDEICQADDPWRNPASMNGALQYIADTKKGKHISVMMPYSQRLDDFADWYRQLWAESLGKKYSLDGRIVNVGPTPLKALGATDQHSQVQLYVEGPYDKIITFISVDRYCSELTMPDAYPDVEGISYLGGHALNELIVAGQMATEITLTAAGRPSCRVVLPEVNPFTVGQLIYMYELSTAFAGGLYGINPYDQPGVEGGKITTYAIMGRKGYENKKQEISKRARMDKYVI